MPLLTKLAFIKRICAGPPDAAAKMAAAKAAAANAKLATNFTSVDEDNMTRIPVA